ncbi:hypothetical protein JYU14_00640 [Simkania negevensis]|uniref:Tetratricopeptide repeat protein n=1 Tax=Simkania negevensis TaxID=83561 RepID=A0ABS3APJ0_9BACT|nr:hypothetical protein [Simkania negevensis]
MMKVCLFVFLFFGSINSLLAVDQQALLKAVDRIAQQQKNLADEIDSLRLLLGASSKLDILAPIDPPKRTTQRVKLRYEDGIKAYKEGEYEKAKESFQLAWEATPESGEANFNLGLAYYKIGNTPLAKKMLKATLDVHPSFPHAKEVRSFLEGENYDSLAQSKEEETEEMVSLRNDLKNMQKEIDSYLQSKDLAISKKMRHAVELLQKMQGLAAPHKKLQQEILPSVADTYALFHLYKKAMKTLDLYEKSMEGKVLEDGYYSSKLKLEQKYKEQQHQLSEYLGNTPEDRIALLLERDMEELRIFAAQMDEFVSKANSEDPDFQKICQRLAEYQWGNKKNRHVVVANRFQDLLFSSLPGTLPLNRYQDKKGRRFFGDILLLADNMEEEQTEYVEIPLSINGEEVNYILMYTYIPKHSAFIMVRLPKEDFV